jgi:hypothetical protein
MMRHESNALLRLASFGDVIDDRDQEFSVALRVADNDATGGLNENATFWCFDLILFIICAAAIFRSCAVKF